MSQYLFLFTLGPVQSFIAQARKTQDLYAGSRLLSELIKTAIDEVGRDKIIFPYAPSDSIEWTNIESLPNRFIAQIDIAENELNQKGIDVEKAVRDKWKDIADKTLVGVHAKPHGFDEQIAQHLDIFWVFEPFTEGVTYADAFRNIEKQLGAIKNIRAFEQFNYGVALGERGRKCSLDGQRNIKFYRKSEKQDKRDKLTDVIVKQRFLFSQNGDARILSYDDTWLKISELQPGEGLSAVSFVKRRYDTTEFDSTSKIALADWISDLLLKNGFNELKQYQKSFSEFNDQLYFDENLTDDYFKKQGIKLANNQTLEQIQNSLKSLKSKTNKKQSKYYAALAFDGDYMGQWLSGDSELLKEGVDLQTFHKAFAERLATFSEFAKGYLDGNNRGKTVYAGGDDFLGFVNLNSLFDVLKMLRAQFKTLVNNELKQFVKEEISFSAGVCIAHYKEPLSIVLGKAKHMEEAAKDYTKGEKDKLGIVVLRGSGQEHEMVVSFKNNNVQHLEDLTFALRDEKVSNTFIQNFDRQFLSLTHEGNEKGKKEALLGSDILNTEFTRLIKKDKKAEVNTLAKNTWSLFDRKDLGNFIKVMNTCNFIHRHLSKA
jgi:CRISPR-associated protein Cmr2